MKVYAIIIAIWCSFYVQFEFISHMIICLCREIGIVTAFNTSPFFEKYAWGELFIGDGWAFIIMGILWDIAIYRAIQRHAWRKLQRQLEKQTLD
jgi:hypothetical protein